MTFNERGKTESRRDPTQVESQRAVYGAGGGELADTCVTQIYSQSPHQCLNK